MRSSGTRTADPPRSTVLTIATALAAACATLYVAVPLVAPFLVFAAVLLLATRVHQARQAGHEVPALNAPAAAVLLAWFALTTLWSADRKAALVAVALFTCAAVAVFLTAMVVDGLATDLRRVLAMGFVIGLGLVMWLSLLEQASGHALRRLVNSVLPLTRPHSILARSESGWIQAFQPYVSNKSIAAAMVLAWPMLLLSRSLATTIQTKVLRVATVAALAIAVFWSEHETSKIALLLSGGMFLLAKSSRGAAFGVLVVGWFTATLAVVPLALIAYGSGAHLIESIQYSGRHRLVIWGETSNRALERPLRGHGLASTRMHDEMSPPEQRRTVPGTSIPRGTNVHAHNVFVQTWHETGLIGAVLLALAGLPVLAWLRARSDATAAHHYAAFVAAVVLASLSWSLVASWYIATFGIVAMACLFAEACARDELSTLPATTS